jgi:hypothetical protein
MFDDEITEKFALFEEFDQALDIIDCLWMEWLEMRQDLGFALEKFPIPQCIFNDMLNSLNGKRVDNI